jgi:hypothetical protein
MLEIKVLFLQAIYRKHIADWLFLFTLESTRRKILCEGLFSRERKNLPCVMWGSGISMVV